MKFLNNDDVCAKDLNTVNNLKKLANNPKTSVKSLMSKVKSFLPKFYQHDDDPLISSVDDEYQRLTFNNTLIFNGHHMLAYLLNHVINLQTIKHDSFAPSYKVAFKYNRIIDNIAKKVTHKSTLYTLWNGDFSDFDNVKLTRTIPKDFNSYILNGMAFKIEDNLVDKVNDEINKGEYHVLHDTRYHQLMKFINKDCSLTKCSPCKFYQGKKYNYSEKDLSGKDLQEDLWDIADKNGYSKASDRLMSYFMSMAKADLGKFGLDMVIADAQIYDNGLKHQEDTVDELIGQHWNNFPMSNSIFYYEPKKTDQPTKCYQDDSCVVHCPINDDVLHLHGEIELS